MSLYTEGLNWHCIYRSYFGVLPERQRVRHCLEVHYVLEYRDSLKLHIAMLHCLIASPNLLRKKNKCKMIAKDKISVAGLIPSQCTGNL